MTHTCCTGAEISKSFGLAAKPIYLLNSRSIKGCIWERGCSVAWTPTHVLLVDMARLRFWSPLELELLVLLEAVEEQLQTPTLISSLILVVNLINAILKSN